MDGFYRQICNDLCHCLRLRSRIEWDRYGSGYASYIDAWFYRDTAAFKPKRLLGVGHEYVGLWVLFHRRTPYYVMGQGEKRWRDRGGGSSYLPTMDGVDDLAAPAIRELSLEAEPELAAHGLIRLRRDEIERPIPTDIAIKTNLSTEQMHLFDALFHWED